MEKFVDGGCFGEGKGDGEILVVFWSQWWMEWRWRRKKMMVGFCRSCDCGGCGGNEGVGGGQGFDGEMKREEGEKGFVFGIGVKGEGKNILVRGFL